MIADKCAVGFVALLGFSAVRAADNPRHLSLGPEVQESRTLEQNWTDSEANWFYNAGQGSQLMPYRWFVHLEQPASEARFLDPEHIRALGYLAREPDDDNPDGLPVGFVRDAAYEDGTEAVGLTCAACHTAQINYQGRALIVDGAPSMGDIEELMRRLASSLQNTAQDDAKFQRFGEAVLGPSAPAGELEALRVALRSVARDRADYNARNLPPDDRKRFGPGRVDAFGAIFNEVTVRFLEMPDNIRAADAPVSYPCLWDAPQHDRVQWNGAAENATSLLGRLLFGTTKVGALGRNSGEVLGVFGAVHIPPSELLLPRTYPSTVNKTHLLRIEDSLEELWSPLWPEGEFGELDAELVAKGAKIFKQNCCVCHGSIDRMDDDRSVKAQMKPVGTDPKMAANFARTAKAGRLAGRRASLLRLNLLDETEPAALLLKHVVERVMLEPAGVPVLAAKQNELIQANGARPRAADDELGPGFRVSAMLETPQGRLVGEFDEIVADETSLQLKGGTGTLLPPGQSEPDRAIAAPLELGDEENTQRVAEALGGQVERTDDEDRHGEPTIRLNRAQTRFAYKARPLNGVWATAPYLHNGSVPSLAQLLLKPEARSKPFHVGSREYDPVNVGFRTDEGPQLFDTTIEGNSNAGHDFGSELSEDERRQLLEYLKSL